MKNAKDVSALKAVSQNLIHESLTITDGVYGILSDSDVRKQIVGLGEREKTSELSGIEELISINKQLLQQLKQRRVVG